jgi:tetratricopeptide (TPR) repeat protein
MGTLNKEYEISDPSYYDPLIARQKKIVSKRPFDPGEWLELGRLHEAKIDMTNYVARNSFGIRYFMLIYFLTFIIGAAFYIFIFSKTPYFPLITIIILSTVPIILLVATVQLWLLRYPRSGKKYFKKAISFDPECGEAYMHLGHIALRSYQKRKACRLLEQALKFNFDNKKIERELKSIYEKEFFSFFNRKTQKETRLQEIIDYQLKEIKTLYSKVSSLENLTERLSERAEQAKWKTNHTTKLMTKEMDVQLDTIQKDYEKQIAGIKQSFEIQRDTENVNQKDFIRLTTEIMEAKAEFDGSSFARAEINLEKMMGASIWQAFSPRTRTYLATAEHTYEILAKGEGKPDYSLIGMELCKALESEINRNLVTPFVHHLNGNKSEFLDINKVGTSKGRPVYFTYLARIIDEENYSDTTSLTLGQYHFILKRTLEGDYALKEYKNFLDRIDSSSIDKIGKKFLKNLTIVTKRYRNAIAHEAPMNLEQCNHLRKLIFSGEKALLKTCCRIGCERIPVEERIDIKTVQMI